ncbi:fumarate hydratase [Actinomycetospora sp. NBRC 106375]|uniref:fumarate hydratase C-terminal domain-containing protein n=1 Tax=Actinomycetospora sp. NBRC 106375 TaxID=3032207 RepID=UPI0024A2D879|nr:fumarate hydratase C-terminal domain-containing protein [Actinomycetospora sp. NBRC 106375]GLZ45234.1 fumarate hydratase [Actinomycetospora sp. NBRC 106375]
MTELSLPLDAEAIRALHSGDSVLLSGPLVTGRDAAHERFARAVEGGERLPFDPAGETLYFVGPTPARPGHAIGAAGPTTASRMDAWSPLLVERGLRGMIGKGRRSETVKESMLEHGCVYFGAIEGTAALLSQCITASEVIAYEDLGAEAVRRLEVRDFPALVVNDLHGGDLYRDGPARWRRAPS